MKYDMSKKISETVADYGVSYRAIAEAAGVSKSTISRAARAGYMVTKPVRDAIMAGCNKVSMYTPTAVIAANLEKQLNALKSTAEQVGVSFAQGHEISTEQLAQGLQDQVNAMRNTITGSGLVDDQLESAHSCEKAELQKALAVRVEQVQNLRQKNATQAASIGQCFTEIHLLQDELNHQKLITASRNADLAVYQKELEDADNRADDAEYKAAELERDLTVQRAWIWFFVVMAFVSAVVGVIK